MNNLIKINVKIPHFLQEIKASIASLEPLSDFASRFCVLIAHKKELEQLPPIISLKDFLLQYLNIDERMFVFIEQDILDLFTSKTLFLKNSLFDKNTDLWSINFTDVYLNKKIQDKVLNEEYYALSNRDTSQTKIILTPLLPNRPVVIATSKTDFEIDQSPNQIAITRIAQIMSQDEYELKMQENLRINRQFQEVKEIKVVDQFLTWIAKEHEFTLTSTNDLFIKNSRAERLLQYVQKGFISKHTLQNIIFEKFNFALPPSNLKVFTEQIHVNFADYQDYTSNIINKDIGLGNNICLYKDRLFLLSNYTDLMKIDEIDLSCEIKGIQAQELTPKEFEKIDLNNLEDQNVIKILVKWIENLKIIDNAKKQFIHKNFKLFDLNKFITQLSTIFTKAEIQDLFLKKMLNHSQENIQELVQQNIYDYNELYLLVKWEYQNKQIFENWDKEINFWKLIALKNEFEKNKTILNLQEVENLWQQVKTISILPIKDIRIDNFYKNLMQEMDVKKIPAQKIIDAQALELRRQMEKTIGVDAKNNFSKILDEHYRHDKNYTIWKQSYIFLSKVIHGEFRIDTIENLQKFEDIKKAIKNVKLTSVKAK